MTRGPDVEVALAPDHAAPAQARRTLAGLARPPAALQGDPQLVVSELVTNSVRHAGMADDRRIGLRVWCDPTRVRVEVDDEGPGFALGDGGGWPPGESVTGRGLPLLMRIADGCGTRRADGRFGVWLTVDRRPAHWPHLVVLRPTAWRADGRPPFATTAVPAH